MTRAADSPILRASTWVQLLRLRAEERPDAPAFLFLRDGETAADRFTYAGLDAAARALAVRLADRGARPGDRALLLYPPGLGFIAAFFGCLYAGVVAVPAYPPRTGRRQGSDPRLRSIAADARPAWVLAPKGGPAGDVPELAGAGWLATEDSDAAAETGAWREPDLSGGSLAFLQYTSGSTATPKGVMVTHANLLANEEMIRRAFGTSEASVVVGWLPLYHDMGLIGNVLQPLYSGARCVLMSPLSFLQRPARWLEAISRYRGTTSGGPDFAYDLCVRKVKEEERARLDLSSWERAFNGAEPVRAQTLERFADAFAPAGFRRRAFSPCYGLAEATLFVTGGDPDAGPTVGTFAGRERVGCGHAWLGQRVAIVDPETCGELPVDQIGEIWVAGPAVAAGYWGKPEETARDFHARLAGRVDEGPFLRTGDLGFVHGGELFVTGRIKDLIILRGRNHYPQDLERTAEAAHAVLVPGASAAFSSGCLIDADGEERLVLVAEVQRRQRDAVDVEEVADAVRRAVAEEHEVRVHEVVLIETGTLPRTSSGKVRRGATRDAWTAGELRTVGASRLDVEIAEETGTPFSREALLALPAAERLPALTAWLRDRAARAARVRPALLTPDRPLTAVGLDSLAAIELKNDLDEELGTGPDLSRLLEGATLDDLAADLLTALDRGEDGEARIVPGTQEGVDQPLSVGQRALWFLEKLHPETTAFLLVGAARISAPSLSPSPVRPPHTLPERERGATAQAQEKTTKEDREGAPSPARGGGEGARAGEGWGGGGRGDLDLPAFRRALEAVVARHPALRTTFHSVNGEPRQRIEPSMPVEIWEEDAGGWTEEQLRARLDELAYRPFDLAQGPLFRVGIFREPSPPGPLSRPPAQPPRERGDVAQPAVPWRSPSPGEGDGSGGRGGQGVRALFLTIHHLISDFWSLGLLLRELETLYVQESPALLLPVRLSFPDFVRWQESRLAGPRGEELWRYWSRQLAGAPRVLDLPTDRPRPAVQTTRGAFVGARLAPELTGNLEALARSHNTTLYTILLAAFSVLLHRWSGQDDLLLGSPTTGRGPSELAGMMGYFINPVVMRSAIEEGPSFAAHLDRTRETALAAFAHQDLPFPLLAERLQPERDPSRSPVFQVFFVLEQARLLHERGLSAFALGDEGARMDLLGLRLESLRLPRRSAQFDLMLLLSRLDGGLGLALECNADLFDAATAGRLLGGFRTLLEGAVADPFRPVGLLPLLTAEEQDQIQRWGAGADVPAPTVPLHRLFEEQAARRPDAVAVIFQVEELTYRRLNEKANRLAHRLRALGVGPEVPVGLAVERGLDLLVGLLGILKAGGAYVPLDPSYPAERLAWMQEDAFQGIERPVVVTTKPSPPIPLSRLPAQPPRERGDDSQPTVTVRSPSPGEGGGSGGRGGQGVRAFLADPTLLSESAENPAVAVDPGSLAYILYTSGSTGRPKGVMVTHGNVVRLLASTDPWFGFGPDDVWTLFHSFAFDFSVWEIWGALAFGGRLVVVPRETAVDTEAFRELLATERVTVLNQTPSAFRALSRMEDKGDLSLRWVIFGGEALEPASLRPWFERRFERNTDERPRLVNMYGITETTVHVTFRPLAARDTAGGSFLGVPIPDLRLHAVDRNLMPVPAGVPGELCVGGAGVARGYRNRPDLTAERFVPDPFGPPGERLYRSGDLARFRPGADGLELEYLGRIDHQVKVRGFRIELGEIEAVLAACPAVQGVVVLARSEGSDVRLIAYVELVCGWAEVSSPLGGGGLEQGGGQEGGVPSDRERPVPEILPAGGAPLLTSPRPNRRPPRGEERTHLPLS